MVKATDEDCAAAGRTLGIAGTVGTTLVPVSWGSAATDWTSIRPSRGAGIDVDLSSDWDDLRAVAGDFIGVTLVGLIPVTGVARSEIEGRSIGVEIDLDRYLATGRLTTAGTAR